LAGVIGIGDDVVVEHAVRKGFGGMNDEDWIPLIANEGWVIITADSGKQTRQAKGKKLPAVCKEWRVTYAACSPAIVHFNSFEKYRLMLGLWDSLIALKDSPRGTGYSIRLISGRPALVLKHDALPP
jgi:hypothetical protein